MFAAVDKDGLLFLHPEKPFMNSTGEYWITENGNECNVYNKHAFFEMIGRVLTWEDEPIELAVINPQI